MKLNQEHQESELEQRRTEVEAPTRHDDGGVLEHLFGTGKPTVEQVIERLAAADQGMRDRILGAVQGSLGNSFAAEVTSGLETREQKHEKQTQELESKAPKSPGQVVEPTTAQPEVQQPKTEILPEVQAVLTRVQREMLLSPLLVVSDASLGILAGALKLANNSPLLVGPGGPAFAGGLAVFSGLYPMHLTLIQQSLAMLRGTQQRWLSGLATTSDLKNQVLQLSVNLGAALGSVLPAVHLLQGVNIPETIMTLQSMTIDVLQKVTEMDVKETVDKAMKQLPQKTKT